MAFASTDLIAAERSSTTYQETYGNRANIDSTDWLMVERSNTKYKCARYEWDGGGAGSSSGMPGSTPVATDLLLVERPSATLNMTALLGATTLYVNAIPAALSSGTRLVFDGTAGNAEFILTSSASAGATTLYGTGGLKGSQVNNYTVGGVLYKATKADWDGSGSYTDIHSANYAINPITTLYGQATNNSNPYSVVEVQVEVTSSATYASGDLYIGFRNTAPTAFYGDLPIAAVQILQSNGTSFRTTASHDCAWNFALGNVAHGYYDWGTTTTAESITTSPASHSYSSIGTSPTPIRFSYTTSGTTSANVGAQRGIPILTYTGDPATSNILPVGSANVSQSSSSSDGYIFTECSSPGATNDVTWLSLATTGNIYNGDRIRICYFGGGNGFTSSTGLQTTNSLYIRFI